MDNVIITTSDLTVLGERDDKKCLCSKDSRGVRKLKPSKWKIDIQCLKQKIQGKVK